MPGPEIDNAVDKESKRIEKELQSGKAEDFELRMSEYELKKLENHTINMEILNEYKLNTFNLFSLCFINDSNELQMKDGAEHIEGEYTYIMVNGKKIYKEGDNGLSYYFDGKEFSIYYRENGKFLPWTYVSCISNDGFLIKGMLDENKRLIDGRKAYPDTDHMYDITNGYRTSDYVKYNVDKFYKAVDGEIDSVNPYQEPNTEIEQQENKLVL